MSLPTLINIAPLSAQPHMQLSAQPPPQLSAQPPPQRIRVIILCETRAIFDRALAAHRRLVMPFDPGLDLWRDFDSITQLDTRPVLTCANRREDINRNLAHGWTIVVIEKSFKNARRHLSGREQEAYEYLRHPNNTGDERIRFLHEDGLTAAGLTAADGNYPFDTVILEASSAVSSVDWESEIDWSGFFVRIAKFLMKLI